MYSSTTASVPVKPGYATEPVDILEQLVHDALPRRFRDAAVLGVTSDIFGQELPAGSPCRHHVVVAVETTPFGEVVGNVEGCRRWRGIFVVDEAHHCRFIF